MVSKTEGGATTTYTYDYANRLVEMQNAKCQMLNTYDGYGRRVSRLVKGSGFGIPEAEKTEYLWDGTNVLLEFYQNQNNPLEYVYGNGQLLARDDLLVLPVSKRLVYQNTHWFHQDGLGSIVNLTDEAGKVTLSYNYDAFGEITKEEGEVGWKKNRYTFTGKPYDPAAGMYYFGARWYEEEVGRFVTKDLYTFTPEDPRIMPYHGNFVINLIAAKSKDLTSIPNNPTKKILSQWMMNPEYFHRYVYVMNNPVRYIDPYGLCPKEDWGLYGGITWWEWGVKLGFIGGELGLRDTKAFLGLQLLLLQFETGVDIKEGFYYDTSMGLEFQAGPLYGGWDIVKFTETLWGPEGMKKFLEWVESKKQK